MTFVLSETTYKRFGLTGIKHGNLHYVVLQENQRKELLRIRPCEPIEGILSTENLHLYTPYVKKFKGVQYSVNFWSPTKEFTFDVGRLTSDADSAGWRAEFIEAVDRCLLERDVIPKETRHQRITIKGMFSLKALRNWIDEVAAGGWALLLVWDMADIPGAVLGKKTTMRGLGGGCEAVLYGSALPVALRFQTVSWVCDE